MPVGPLGRRPGIRVRVARDREAGRAVHGTPAQRHSGHDGFWSAGLSRRCPAARGHRVPGLDVMKQAAVSGSAVTVLPGRGVPVLPVVGDLEEGVLPPRRREQDPLHTRHHCWAPPSRPRPAVHSLAPQAEHVDLGIVRMAQPCDREHACNRKADRDPFTRSLHARPPHGHRAEPDQRDEAKSQVTALRAETPTGSRPQTYALRCVAHRYPISPDSKVTRNKKPQVRGLTRGFPWSPLSDSNRRPTHYKTMRDRVA